MAVPALLTCLTNTDSNLRFRATAALATCQGEPSVLVPAFTERLNDSDAPTRSQALVGLSRFGPLASNSAPAVIRLLNDPEVYLVRPCARECLQAIAGSKGAARGQPSNYK